MVIGITLKATGLIAVYLLTNRLTRRRALELASAFLVALLILPVDLYGTDKIFIYPVAMLAGVVCLARPSRAWMLGAITATAFLFRHDHGLYVVVPLTLALVLADDRRWRHALAAVIALGIIVVPWLIWVESTEGIVSYLASRAAFAQVLGLTASRSSFGFAGIASPAEAGLRGLWLLAWAIPLVAGALAVRMRDRAVLVVAVGALLASAGLMRRFGQHADVASMWVPLGAWIVVQPSARVWKGHVDGRRSCDGRSAETPADPL